MERVFKGEKMTKKVSNNKKQERLYNLDLLKTIAIICVIFIHNFYLQFNYLEANILIVLSIILIIYMSNEIIKRIPLIKEIVKI